MTLSNPRWLVRCKSVTEKQDLFDYAAGLGIPAATQPLKYGATPYRDDRDLDLRWLATKKGAGLFALPVNEKLDVTHTAGQFRQLCDQAAAMMQST